LDHVKRPAAFLDRDGVLNVKPREHGYVRSANDFRWLPGAAKGAARLARAGYVLAVVSNQRGVARGLVEPNTLAEIEARIQARLREYGARIEAFRYCAHELGDGCHCRKPAPGMIFSLATELGLDLTRSWTIGDSSSDVAAGHAAGTFSLLVADARSEAAAASQPELVAPSLLAGSELILGPEGRP
jgi:D-glycero-D-manno-heptose 1,7-bisphosphate phosphatase